MYSFHCPHWPQATGQPPPSPAKKPNTYNDARDLRHSKRTRGRGEPTCHRGLWKKTPPHRKVVSGPEKVQRRNHCCWALGNEADTIPSDRWTSRASKRETWLKYTGLQRRHFTQEVVWGDKAPTGGRQKPPLWAGLRWPTSFICHPLGNGASEGILAHSRCYNKDICICMAESFVVHLNLSEYCSLAIFQYK